MLPKGLKLTPKKVFWVQILPYSLTLWNCRYNQTYNIDTIFWGRDQEKKHYICDHDHTSSDPEAEKLKTFQRADFCVQNFPDDKKVRKFKFCGKKVRTFLGQRCIIEIKRVNKQETRSPKILKCSRSKTIRPIKMKISHHVDLMRSTCCELFSFLCLIVLDLEHAEKLKATKFTSCWYYEINMMWTCQLFMPNRFGIRAFQSFGQPHFVCLFTLNSHFMVCFIFLCLYYTDPFKIPSMNIT